MTKKNKQQGIIEITHKQMLIISALLMFFCGWMFILGILVGRETVPIALKENLLDKELTKLRASVTHKWHKQLYARASGQSKEKNELDFYEALKETDPQKRYTFYRSKIELPAETKKTEGEGAVRVGPKKETSDEIWQTDTKNNNVDFTAQLPQDNEKTNHYTVQVASFKKIDEAEHLVSKLRDKGYHAYQIRSDLSDKGVWYRVRVGAFLSYAAARQVLNELGAGEFNGLIVATK
ncbi:MAG: SPOR domain-containing protein [Desulfobacteraceae bacterium]|nr:SPOR domain-containing protein [Desulfobacteraceae bacterium]